MKSAPTAVRNNCLDRSPIFTSTPFGAVKVFSTISTPTPGRKIKYNENTSKIGYPITAIIRISNSPGERCTCLTASTQEIPEVLECYCVTCSDSLIMKVMASSVEHLESLIDRLSEHGQLTTSIVLSTVLSRKIVTPTEINASHQKLETIA